MDILRGVCGLAQISQVTIDSLLLRLHSNATVILLVSFSIAVTTREYVGNPIECVTANRASGYIPEDTLNTYCWIHATYTVPAALWKVAGRQVAYPGVANSKDPDATVKHVKYYQWVAFMLFFQVCVKNWFFRVTGELTRKLEKFLSLSV